MGAFALTVAKIVSNPTARHCFYSRFIWEVLKNRRLHEMWEKNRMTFEAGSYISLMFHFPWIQPALKHVSFCSCKYLHSLWFEWFFKKHKLWGKNSVTLVLHVISPNTDWMCSPKAFQVGREEATEVLEQSHCASAQKCWAVCRTETSAFSSFFFMLVWKEAKQFVHNELWPEYFLKLRPNSASEFWKRLLESYKARNSPVLPN